MLNLCISTLFFTPNSNKVDQDTQQNSRFKLKSIESNPGFDNLITNGYTGSDLQQLADYGSKLPFEGELPAYEMIQGITILQNAGGKVVDQLTNENGTTYILGNYDYNTLDFSATGLLTIGSSLNFVSGTQSTTSSFILAYDYNQQFLFGKQLDFDDDFDYYMVSMEFTGPNFILLAENRSAISPNAFSQVDITLFNYTSDFLSVQFATFGGIGRETLGIPYSLDFGITDIPSDLLEIDNSGNIIVAGVTHSPIFHPMTNKIGLSQQNYQESFDFLNINYADPVYNNLTFSSNWTNDTLEYSGITDFYDIEELTQDTYTGNSITGLPSGVQFNALTNTYNHIEYNLPGYNVTSIESYVTWMSGAGTMGVTWAPGIGIRWGNSAGISLHYSEFDGNSIHYQYWINGGWGEGQKTITPSTAVYLRIELNYTSGGFEFLWSYDDVTWTSLNGDYALLNGVDVNTKSLNEIDLTQTPIVSVGKFAYDGAGSNVNFGDDLTDVNYDGSYGTMGTSQFDYLIINSTAIDLPSTNNSLTNSISFNKAVQSASFIFNANITGLSVGFFDTQGSLLYSKEIILAGIPKLITYSSDLPIIKSIQIIGIPDDLSRYFSISDLSVSRINIPTTFSDFGTFNGNANEAIQDKISGVYFNNWVSYNSSGTTPAYSGDFAIFISNQVVKSIVFDTQTSYVSFYASSLPGDSDHTVTIYDENNNTLGSKTFSPGITFIEFSLTTYNIKYVDFSAWTTYDYAIDDFSFIDASNNYQPFLLKLDSSFNYISSAVMQPNQASTQVAITSLELNDTDNIHIAGISNGNFSEMGLTSPYHSLDFRLAGTAFITSFDTSLNIDSMTTIGGSLHSAIYDLHFNASKMYATGQSLSDNLILNPNILLDGFQPSNGSGFIAEITSDWNIPYFLRVGDPNFYVDGSVVTQIQTQSAFIYYSGSFNMTSIASFYSGTGVFATSTPTGSDGDAIPYLGILNSSRDVVYSNLLNGYNSDKTRISVNPNSGEILWVDQEAKELKVYSINDTDSDGLSNYKENVIGSNSASKDSDGDGIPDGIEVYRYLTSPINTDSDGDCMPDLWEIQNGQLPNSPDTNVDTDGDGLNSYEEYIAGTDFLLYDTDFDGLSDYEEYYIYRTNGTLSDSDFDNVLDQVEVVIQTNPNLNDTDYDGLSDYTEFVTTHNLCDIYNISNCFSGKTDPLLSDMDFDGLSDYEELMLSMTIPWIVDSDGDGFSDYEEFVEHGSDGWKLDSDGDTLNDTYEILFSRSNVSNSDSDYDGLNDAQEFIYGTDPWISDTDKDGLTDGFEVFTSMSSPLFADFDNDTLSDAIEYIYGSNSSKTDSDDDELPDWWEYQYGLDSTLNETYSDPDSDGLLTIMEYYNNTNPVNNDTDADSLDDYMELLNGTDPNNPDTDADTILDGSEVYIYFTNPLEADSDFDLLLDQIEIFITFSDPNDQDSDDDGLTDYEEVDYKTSLLLNDTDSDNIIDYFEIREYLTDPLNSDTDGDGLSDYDEIFVFLTDPLIEDTDQDLILDGEEVDAGIDPLDSDSDDDGLLDGEEAFYSTDYSINDTDSDGLLDGEEVNFYGSNPTLQDTDGDGMLDYYEASNELIINVDDADGDPDNDDLNNLAEMRSGTDPNNPDSDFDGYKDGYEINHNMDPLSFDEPPNNADRLIGGAQENPWAATGGGLALLGALIMFTNLLIGRLRKPFGA